jgi:hypothetical protein
MGKLMIHESMKKGNKVAAKILSAPSAALTQLNSAFFALPSDKYLI